MFMRCSTMETLERRRLLAHGGGTDGGGMYFVTQGDQITVQGTDSGEQIKIVDLGLDRRTGKLKVAVSRNGQVITTFYNFHQFVVNGNGGDDTISIVSANPTLLTGVTVNGGAGNDTITAAAFNGGSINAFGGSGNDNITGSAGPDVLNGGSGHNVLSGGDGDDVFVKKAAAAQGGVGNDALLGGNGIDTVQVVFLVGDPTPDFGSNTFSGLEAVTYDATATADPAETGQPPIL